MFDSTWEHFFGHPLIYLVRFCHITQTYYHKHASASSKYDIFIHEIFMALNILQTWFTMFSPFERLYILKPRIQLD